MPTPSYARRREQLTTYFNETAAATWQALTSNDPVSRIRATVRAGRDTMRATLLDWLPEDLTGRTLFDAGCGTGALAIAAAERGATVIAIDIADNLVDIARRRAARHHLRGTVDFRVGDMLREAPARVDHVVAMDSLIHYEDADVRKVVADLSARARQSVLFTTAPWNPMLGAMHVVGRLIPHRHHRAPAIVPIRVPQLMDNLDRELGDAGWTAAETRRIKSGFYISQAIRLERC